MGSGGASAGVLLHPGHPLALADGRFLILDKRDLGCDMVSVRFGDRDLDDPVFDDVDDCVGWGIEGDLRWERTLEII